MSHLSSILERHFRRKGNRIVFKNKVSLNDFSLLMWEILRYQGIDSSVLSRVIHGERLFTYKQLKVFCKVLALPGKEKLELEQALGKDILLRSNIPLDVFKTESYILDSFRKNSDHILTTLRLLRKDGHPEEAISLSQTLESIIHSKSLQNQDKKILGMIYNERSRAFGETSSPQRVLRLMTNLNEKAIELGEEIKDTEILDMAYMNVGGAHYVAKRWKDSSTFLESKLEKVKNQTKLEFMRTLLLDYAYLKDYSRFRDTLSKTIRVIDKYSSNDSTLLASIYEATARSFSIFGFNKEAIKILEEAEKLSSEPFYSSQIIRGYIFTFYSQKKRGGKVDTDRLNFIIETSRKERFAPYKRHRNQIEKMVKKIELNL